MKTTITLLSLALLGLLTSCKEKKEKSALTEQTVEAVQPVQPTPAPAKPVAETQPAKKKNYHLVAGCFVEQENAERLNKALVSKGYDSQIFSFYRMHMVTYNSYETRAEAQKALNLIVQESGKELTWVYPVK